MAGAVLVLVGGGEKDEFEKAINTEGRLNDGEQNFINHMRLEQMREAPSRVRYTWGQGKKGNPVPHGWHTLPGKDMVRMRKMEWGGSRKT